MQDGTTAAAKNLLGITDSRHRSCLRFGCLSCRMVGASKKKGRAVLRPPGIIANANESDGAQLFDCIRVRGGENPT
jgi:hypothetical protein